MDYIINTLIFFGIVVVMVAGLFVVVWWKKDRSLSATLEYLKATGDGAIKDILLASAAVLAFIVGAIIFNLILSNIAEGAEYKWLEETTVYAGLDYVEKGSPQCYPEPDSIDDKLTSNIGIRQSIVKINNVSILANYTHHSCAIGYDDYGYDGVGVQVEWRIGR